MDISVASAAMRFGYGLPFRFADRDGLMASLRQAAAESPPADGSLSRRRIIDENELRSRLRLAPAIQKEMRQRELRRTVAQWYQEDRHAYIAAAVTTPSPFFSRLTAFWSNHFTVSVKKGTVRGLAGPFVKEAIIPHVMGTFEELALAAEMHPAMVIYLDLMNSVGPNSPAGKHQGKGLNENLAREILELHSLGVNGGYSQGDVTEFAKIMTGWTINHPQGVVQFAPRRAEPGTKKFLGKKFGGNDPNEEDYKAALRLVARHQSTARFIATKLVKHFISDPPPADVVSELENAFKNSSGSLPEIYGALLDLPQAWEKPGAKVRSPFEFLVAALRAADLENGDLQPVQKNGSPRPNPISVEVLNIMQQQMWMAPSPAGWPEGAEDWLSPAKLAQRLSCVPRLARRMPDNSALDFLDRVFGPLASPQTRSIVKAASNRQEGLSLLLASPEFNRR